MRRVMVSKFGKFNKETKQLSKVECGEANFHSYGLDVLEYADSAASYTAAIVEFDNGLVELVQLALIRFLGIPDWIATDRSQKPEGVFQVRIDDDGFSPPGRDEPYLFRDRDSGEYKVLNPNGTVTVLQQSKILDGVLEKAGQRFNVLCRCDQSFRDVLSPFKCPNCGTVHELSDDD